VEIDAVIFLPTNSKKMNFPYRNYASSLVRVSAVSSALFSPGTLVLCYYARMFNPSSHFCEPFFLVVLSHFVLYHRHTCWPYAFKHKLYKATAIPRGVKSVLLS
jgi:hypothetical protein